MWQAIQTITGYKSRSDGDIMCQAKFPDELNTFYARCDLDDKSQVKTTPGMLLNGW